MPAAAPAMAVKPKIPAINAMTKNISVQRSIMNHLWQKLCQRGRAGISEETMTVTSAICIRSCAMPETWCRRHAIKIKTAQTGQFEFLETYAFEAVFFVFWRTDRRFK